MKKFTTLPSLVKMSDSFGEFSSAPCVMED